ncbi:hypothetical protein [Flavipsychrobacter stenotrophus]|nr:hypothetical protein [Flavipsychrobacter stenotrophus]
MSTQETVLNVRYDAPPEIWDKVPVIYQHLEGWLGYHVDSNLPFWYSFDENEKHILASVEPSGLLFTGLMEDAEWGIWVSNIKRLATEILGYKVGEIELGEVDY